MSSRFVLSTPASQDLDEIFAYVLQEGGARRAGPVLDRLQQAMNDLAESPGKGHKREDLTDAPVRFWSVWSFLVVYKPGTKPLEIVRILHGARDVGTILEQDQP